MKSSQAISHVRGLYQTDVSRAISVLLLLLLLLLIIIIIISPMMRTKMALEMSVSHRLLMQLIV